MTTFGIDGYRNIVLEKAPSLVFVELTQGCNLACPMCRASSSGYHLNTMSSTIFAQVADALFPEARMVDLRGWGESLLLRNFCQRVDTVLQYGCELRITSNLSFRNRAALEALARANAIVAVSLDCVNRDVLRIVRGGANLDLILQNLRLLKELYSDQRADFTRVYISATVQKSTIGELAPLVEAASLHGIRKIAFFPRQNNGDLQHLNTIERRALLIDMQKVAEVARLRGLDVRVGARFWHGMRDFLPDFLFPCIKPWICAFVDWSGRIGFCDFLIGTGSDHLRLGRIDDGDFQALWNGRRWADVRRRHLTRQIAGFVLTDSCSWCYENRFVDFEDWFSEDYQSRVLTPEHLVAANQSMLNTQTENHG